MARLWRVSVFIIVSAFIFMASCGEIEELVETKEGIPLSVADIATLSEAVFNAINQTRQANGRGSLLNNPIVAANAVQAAKANLDAFIAAGANRQAGVALVHYRNGVTEEKIVPPDKVKENLYATTFSFESFGSVEAVANDVVTQWLGSLSTATQTGHCENLLFPNHHSLGIGVASGSGAIVVSAGFVCSDCIRALTPRCAK
jgi:uncharacterized protein YkwD